MLALVANLLFYMHLLFWFVHVKGADGKQVRHVEGTEKSHVGYTRMSPFRTLSVLMCFSLAVSDSLI